DWNSCLMCAIESECMTIGQAASALKPKIGTYRIKNGTKTNYDYEMQPMDNSIGRSGLCKSACGDAGGGKSKHRDDRGFIHDPKWLCGYNGTMELRHRQRPAAGLQIRRSEQGRRIQLQRRPTQNRETVGRSRMGGRLPGRLVVWTGCKYARHPVKPILGEQRLCCAPGVCGAAGPGWERPRLQSRRVRQHYRVRIRGGGQ